VARFIEGAPCSDGGHAALLHESQSATQMLNSLWVTMLLAFRLGLPSAV